MPEDLLVARPEGLYCAAGNFHIDAWRPVERCVVTHAHADHARRGHRYYLAHQDSAGTLRRRLGDITLQTLAYGQAIHINGVRISLHPAGHVLGSAQVRVEHGGRIWVVSGDYKLELDATCVAFEPVRCDTFITESTFGLPIYRWREPTALFAQIDDWWRTNATAQMPSLLYCYAFGKAQRLLCGVDASIGPILVHGAIEPLNEVYRAAGVRLPGTQKVTDDSLDAGKLRTSLVLAPPSAAGTTWLRRFGLHADAFASGWMQLRGARRRRGVDRGFVVSDHADWPGLNAAIDATGAQRVLVTHGTSTPMVRWLRERGLQAAELSTAYGRDGDGDDDDEGAAAVGIREAQPDDEDNRTA